MIASLLQDAPSEEVTLLGQQVNLLWIVIGAVLVIFMQAGFALVETGFTRAKHSAHVVSTNFAIFGLGFVAFFLVGYAFMFGGYSYVLPGFDFGYNAPVGDALIGSGEWVFLWQGGFALSDVGAAGGAAVIGFFLYMVAFMDTTATIPTGAMAERWQWKNFVLWGFFCGAIYYPLFGAWTWGGGWLNQLGNSSELGFGYVDFAGSGVVHAMGGAAALAGGFVLGPRIGRYGKDGKPRALPGHHIPMAMLGTFILLFGWFGFNAASTLAATDVQFAIVATNKYGAGWNLTTAGEAGSGVGVTGLIEDFGLGFRQLVAQTIGVVVIWTVMLGLAYLWFKLSDKITPIRSKEEDELVGLDLPEMGVVAYPEFLGHGGVPSTDGAPAPVRVPEEVG